MTGVVFAAEAIVAAERIQDAYEELCDATSEALESLCITLEGHEDDRDPDQTRAEFEQAVVDARVAFDDGRKLLERRSR